MSVVLFRDVLRTLAAIGFFALFRFTEIRWLSFYGVLASSNLATRLLLSRFVHRSRSPLVPPEYTHAKLAEVVSILVSAAVFLPIIQSRFWQLVILLLATATVVRGAKMILLTIQSAFALHELRSDFRAGRPPGLRLPHLLVVGHGAFSARILSAWLLQLNQTLWSTRQQTPDTAVPSPKESELKKGWAGLREAISLFSGLLRHRWLSKASLAAFVTLEEIERLSNAEKQFIIEHAVGTVAVYTRGALWRAMFDTSLEEEEEMRIPVREMVQGSIFLRILAAVGNKEIPTAQTDQHFHAMLHRAAGPVALLVPEMAAQMVESVDDEERQRLRGYELVSAPMRNVSRATPQVVNLIANVVLPLARSDRRLDSKSRAIIPRLAAEGLAPLADAYLRLRLSGSAVERFLCLFDCFEVLIKYSVFALSAPPSAALMTALERPSLGTWTNVLRENLNDKAPLRGDLAGAIVAFWQKPLAVKSRDLVDAVSGAGLAWPDKVPRSHLGWLSWLVWLRNATKGHGGVEEKACLPIWHEFHATLLDAVEQLSPLALASVIWTTDVSGARVALRGWLRGPFRSSTLDLEPGVLAPCNDSPVLIHGDAQIGLKPFVLCEGNACLTWNSGNGIRAEYIEYATGRLHRRTRSGAEIFPSAEGAIQSPE